MIFGERLKALREEKGLSQEAFGKIINKSRSSIAGYEVDDRMPDNKTLLLIADYFECTLDYLFGRSYYKTIQAAELSNSNIFTKETLNNITQWNDIEKEILNLLLGSFEFKELIRELIIYASASPKTFIEYEQPLSNLRKLIQKDYVPETDIKTLKKKYLKQYIDQAIDGVLDFLEENTTRE